MPLLPEIAKALAELPEATEPGRLDPAVMRAAEATQIPTPAQRIPVDDVVDRIAETPTGPVPVRIYTPVEADSYALLVYIHGGAFFLGSLETHDHVARALAKETGHKVVSVGYRLAPEAAYPAGLQDCYGVLRWTADHGRDLNWDGRSLAVCGDSSGATFAAAVAAMAHDDGFDRVTHQVLLYPSLDLDFAVDRYPSLQENSRGYGLETAGLAAFNAIYLDSGADPADPLVSPIKRENLAGLPPALIITAHYDPLRDEGELYGRRLQSDGVEAIVSRYEGVNHGFAQHFWRLPACYRAFEEVAEFLARQRYPLGR